MFFPNDPNTRLKQLFFVVKRHSFANLDYEVRD